MYVNCGVENEERKTKKCRKTQFQFTLIYIALQQNINSGISHIIIQKQDSFFSNYILTSKISTVAYNVSYKHILLAGDIESNLGPVSNDSTILMKNLIPC